MKKYTAYLSDKQKRTLRYLLVGIAVLFLVIASNLFLQWCQNDLSAELAMKFAFSWHTQKFLLGSFVLLTFLVFLISVSGSILYGSIFYSILIVILGIANYLKMNYRQEPIYPDDLKMITEFQLLREMAGTGTFLLLSGLGLVAVGLFIWSVYRSFKKGRRFQVVRGALLITSIALMGYISNFNNPNNLLRQAYNRTALWIPYSQKMNYYNTGFIGGFLYNLKVDPMEKPDGYSKERIQEITKKYQKAADERNKKADTEQPNIIYVMSESFSDPSRLNGVEVTGNPLAEYYKVANQTYSGNMLSQNYGGGTANIEFEALTGLSMALLNPQMTTPYTMLVPKMDQLPSLVSTLQARQYETTAIHPYNTSMYKRKDVYDVLGFDQFLHQDTMTHTDTIENNPYISDESAYQEVLDILADQKQPQFVHLVTMQTHMPYNGKYSNLDYSVKADGDVTSIKNYLQDISYSSQALKNFTEELKKLPRRTLVVFWGDHLPGIYSQETQDANDKQTLHETQFLMFDSQGNLEKQETQDAITSPFYFAANLLEQSNQPTTGFYQLLLALEEEIPAFERSLFYQNGQWHEEAQLNAEQETIFEEYQLLQYDLAAGEQYSLQEGFFE